MGCDKWFGERDSYFYVFTMLVEGEGMSQVWFEETSEGSFSQEAKPEAREECLRCFGVLGCSEELVD